MLQSWCKCSEDLSVKNIFYLRGILSIGKSYMTSYWFVLKEHDKRRTHVVKQLFNVAAMLCLLDTKRRDVLYNNN